MIKFRINPKKEVNWLIISRSIYCFTLAFIALSIIAMVTGGQIFTFRHVIIFSIFAGIPLSIIYAFAVEKIGGGLVEDYYWAGLTGKSFHRKYTPLIWQRPGSANQKVSSKKHLL